MTTDSNVAIVHDYLTQRGGAERVVLSMLRAFPNAPVYTSVYAPRTTFPEFQDVDVRPMKRLNAIGPLRRRHWLGLGIYGRAFRNLRINADVVLCSSSGWAHQVEAVGRKVVYCYTPARWLHHQHAYLRARPLAHRVALRMLARGLIRHDLAAAATADLYVTTSTVMRERISDLYRVEPQVLAPPPGLKTEGPIDSMEIEPGFILVVSRLVTHKNVDAVIQALSRSGHRLIVAGDGPDRPRLERLAKGDVTFLGTVLDSQLRWLYSNCGGVVAASHEDFGLVALEANAFGAPVAALRWGGFLDTVVDRQTGLFFDSLASSEVASTVTLLTTLEWNKAAIRAHAEQFSEESFIHRLRTIVREVAGDDATQVYDVPERM